VPIPKKQSYWSHSIKMAILATLFQMTLDDLEQPKRSVRL